MERIRLRLPVLRRDTLFNSIFFRVLVAVILIISVSIVFWLDTDGLRDSRGEELKYLDILYFTAITITTIGYGDIVPVSDFSRAFNVFVVAPVRVFIWILFIGTAYDIAYTRHREERKMKQIEVMKGHIIVCGFGATGLAAAKELIAKGIKKEDIIIIDKDENALDEASALGLSGIKGDASKEWVLIKAGLNGASDILIVTAKDDTNILISLTARDINKNINIVSRSSLEENIKQMKLSGSNHVISPSLIGGAIIAASSTSRKHVAEFIEDILTSSKGFDIIEMPASLEYTGKKISEIPLTVLQVIHKGQRLHPHTYKDMVLGSDDIIIYLGEVGDKNGR